MTRKTLISLFVVFSMLLSLHLGSLAASAEDYVPELLPAPAADGHLIDGDALKLFFDNYLHENYCDGEDQCLSIALWCPDTDEYWYYNPDVWMYGVNWYRLPVSMYLAEKVSKGELTMDTVVNGITLEYAINTALAATSNPSSSSMVIYLGGNMTTNCADLTKGLSNMPDSYFVDEYYQENAYTARLMLEITKTLYLGGEERFPLVEESMKDAMPEDFFKRDWDVRHEWEIAQVNAAYWGDGAGDRIHCTGIIYSSSPIVLTVMMKNIADMDIMGGIAWRFAHLGTAMGERLHSQDTAAAEAPEAAESAPAAEANVVTDAEEAVIQQDTVAPVTEVEPAMAAEAMEDTSAEVTAGMAADSPASAEAAPSAQVPAVGAEIPSPSVEVPEESAPLPEAAPSSAAKSPFRVFLIGFLILFLAVVAVAVVLIVREQRQRKRRRRRSRQRRD